MSFKNEQNKTQFSRKDDSLARLQAIQDQGREVAKSPHVGGQTSGSRDIHKSGEKSVCVCVCVCVCVHAGGRVQQIVSQQNSKPYFSRK